jgi:aspartate/methionine/tyrosine aminotransferase
VPVPGGAFYCLPRVRTTLPAMTMMERLVREHRVAVIAGETFGATDGCYLRVSFGALEGAAVHQGMERLIGGIRALTKAD